MKKILSIIAIALVGAFVLASCEKEYETEPLKTVNVSGKVTANTNLTSTPNYLDVATAKIIFRINSEELCEKPAGNGYEHINLQYEAPVTNGKYSIDLPAIKDNVTVTILPVPFKAMQIQSSKTEEKVFKAPETTINIYEGGVFYKDIEYNAQ